MAHKFATLAIAMTGLLLEPSAVSASPASDVADLVGARGVIGPLELERRGYSYFAMSHGVQYWWNRKLGSCIGITIAEGRYETVSAATASQCHQKVTRSGSSNQRLESACITAVDANYGGKVDAVRVVKISPILGDIIGEFVFVKKVEFMLDAVGVRGGPQTEHWRCVSSKGGHVEDLSIVQ
jgi:hypothetical protein